MKKLISLLCVIALLFTLCACGDSVSDSSSLEVKTVLSEKCDVDLTKLNTTVAYSQLSNMWQTPDDYMGKTIKIRGTFKVITDNGRNYYSCNIGDATACCSLFLEFILKDDLKYPDEYPQVDTEITVMGEFETYLEGDTTFCQLKDAVLC